VAGRFFGDNCFAAGCVDDNCFAVGCVGGTCFDGGTPGACCCLPVRTSGFWALRTVRWRQVRLMLSDILKRAQRVCETTAPSTSQPPCWACTEQRADRRKGLSHPAAAFFWRSRSSAAASAPAVKSCVVRCATGFRLKTAQHGPRQNILG
jgi:hypothetical protein